MYYLITFIHNGIYHYAINSAVCRWVEASQKLPGYYFLLHVLEISQSQAFAWGESGLKGLDRETSWFPTRR